MNQYRCHILVSNLIMYGSSNHALSILVVGRRAGECTEQGWGAAATRDDEDESVFGGDGDGSSAFMSGAHILDFNSLGTYEVLFCNIYLTRTSTDYIQYTKTENLTNPTTSRPTA